MKEANKIVANGRQNFESTSEYSERAGEIKKEVTQRYSQMETAEPNFFKKILIRIKCSFETKRRLSELSSNKNLHLSSTWD